MTTVWLTTPVQASDPSKWIDKEETYSTTGGKILKVMSSLPKGGGDYIELGGKKYSYVIFWTRIVNQSKSEITLDIKLPFDSLGIFSSKRSYMRLVLPPNKMDSDKVLQGDYGLTNLQSIINSDMAKSNAFYRTIKPKKDCYFYVIELLHQVRGTARSAISVAGENLFYKAKVGQDSTQILIGKVK